MVGTYESFMLPEVMERSKREVYMLRLASAICSEVTVPVITAGRLATGAFAEKAIADGKNDLIGLAHVLLGIFIVVAEGIKMSRVRYYPL